MQAVRQARRLAGTLALRCSARGPLLGASPQAARVLPGASAMKPGAQVETVAVRVRTLALLLLRQPREARQAAAVVQGRPQPVPPTARPVQRQVVTRTALPSLAERVELAARLTLAFSLLG